MGAAAAGGLVIGDGLLLPGRASAGTLQQQHAIYLEPGAAYRGDYATGALSDFIPWAVPGAYAEFAKQLPVAPTFTMEELKARAEETAACGCSVASASSNRRLEDVIALPLSRYPDTSDIAASLEAATAARDHIDLSMEFLYQEAVEAPSGPVSLPVIRMIPGRGTRTTWETFGRQTGTLPPGDTTYPGPGTDRATTAGVGDETDDWRKSITVRGWKLQIRGIGFHSLGACVRQRVRHFNMEVHRADPRRPGRFKWTRSSPSLPSVGAAR